MAQDNVAFSKLDKQVQLRPALSKLGTGTGKLIVTEKYAKHRDVLSFPVSFEKQSKKKWKKSDLREEYVTKE
jgi:hypothetical protein